MANDLVQAPHGQYVSVPQADPRSDYIMRAAMSGSTRERGVLLMLHPPTDEQRQVLARRQKELVESFGFDRKKASYFISEMLTAYPNVVARGKAELKELIAKFAQELELDPKVPTWAVWRACMDIRMGTAEEIGTVHVPSTAAVRRLCDKYAWAARAELGSITSVLRGERADPVVSAEDRAKISRGWQELLAELRAKAEAVPDDAPPIAQEDLIAMVGQEAWDALPAANVRVPKTVGELVSAATKGLRSEPDQADKLNAE